MVLFTIAVLASPQPKKVVDQNGQPVLHASIWVDGKLHLPIEEDGTVRSSETKGTVVKIVALGFETMQLSWEEWQKREKIVLQEKSGILDEVVVAATRTDRTVESLPLPVTVLNSEKIQQTGGLRLSDVLQEQTGLQIVSQHGTGLQMQGLDSDYILILLDGEPLIGRTAGTFDLNRLSISNIERIEILRGPSSAIYGSEAMAGVINIITKSFGRENQLDVGLRHRSFNTWNPTGNLNLGSKKWNTSLFYDYFETGGFDLRPETIGQTQNPYQAHTAQVKVSGNLSEKWQSSLFVRAYQENSTGEMQSSGNEILDMNNSRSDLNINPTLRFKPSQKFLISLRGMSSWFSTNSVTRFQSDQSFFDIQNFDQFYHRTEVQTDFQATPTHLITLGLGQLIETVDATRYEDKNRFDAGYFFLQHQWDPKPKVNLVTGLRGDLHSQYGGRLSPKIAGQYKFSENFSWQASIGAGFKAPDFRQILLNFNNASSGYYVFGSNLAEEGIRRLENEGLIARVLIAPENLGELKAESSWAINSGLRWKIGSKILVQGNLFRNQITNLIETAPIAQLKSGQNAFSYFNIRSVVTQGLEMDFNYAWNNHLSFSIGYSFLDSRDLDVLERIASGELFQRNSQNQTVRVTRADYGGLFNRSRHSGNVKINYHHPKTGIDLALRGIYRGEFGFADLNGNLILDDKREYAPGWMSLNINLTKTFSNGIQLELGGTNLLNIETPAQPNNPGRMLFTGIQLPLMNFIKN
jgi:outer membrane receptor for ferrienterochelin and colicins